MEYIYKDSLFFSINCSFSLSKSTWIYCISNFSNFIKLYNYLYEIKYNIV